MFSQIQTRLILNSALIIVIVLALITMVLFERANLNSLIAHQNNLYVAAQQAQQLNSEVQHNAFDLSLSMLTARVSREEYDHHNETFQQHFEELRQLSIEEELSEEVGREIEQLGSTFLAFQEISERLLIGFEQLQNGATPDERNEQQQTWQQVQQVIAQINETSEDLTSKIQQLVEEQQTHITERNARLIGLVTAIGVLIIGLIVLMQTMIFRTIGIPLRRLTEGIKRFAQGDLDTRVEVTRSDEVGDLCTSFNLMAAKIKHQQSSLVHLEIVEAARADAEAAHAQVAQQLATIEQQQNVIRELSIPVIPVDEQTLILPLIGAFDTSRLRQVQSRALEALETSKATRLILDISGVPVIDSQVARALLQVVQASSLLGAQVALVGIRPEVAQAVVGLGLELDTLNTYRDLQSALVSLGREHTQQEDSQAEEPALAPAI